MGRTSLYRVLSDEQMLEVWMRQGAGMGFDALLQNELCGEELRALKDMFFQLLYPGEFGGRIRG